MRAKTVLKGVVNGREIVCPYCYVCSGLHMICHSPPTVIPQSIKCFIYAQSCHLLVVKSYCVPQNTQSMYMMWHSIKHTYQSRDSMKISLSVSLLSALAWVLSLKLFTVFLLFLQILGAGFVAKNKNSKRRAYTFHGPIYAWNVNIFQVLLVPRIFYQIFENSKGFQPSGLEWMQVPFLIPPLPTSSLFVGSPGRPVTGRFTQ